MTQPGQRYLEGSWKRLPRHCHIRTLEDLASYAYNYTFDCNPEAHECRPEEDICRRCLLECLADACMHGSVNSSACTGRS